MNKEEEIVQIRQQEIMLYRKRRQIELEIEQENVERLLADGVLQKFKFQLNNQTELLLLMVNEPLDTLDNYYRDTSFPCNLQITDDVGLYANFDDGDYFLSATSLEKLIEFIKQHHLEVDTKTIRNRIEKHQNIVTNLANLLILFGENDV